MQLARMGTPALMGAVMAGGASRRFGSDKSLVMGPGVIAALRDGGVDPIVLVGGVSSGALGAPTLADRYPGEGPLGAVATALSYARRGHVLCVPCDLPRLSPEAVRTLLAPLHPSDGASVADHAPAVETAETAIVATVNGEPQYSVACWPASWANAAHQRLRQGERRLRVLLELGPWVGVELDPDLLIDADEPETLAHIRAKQSATTDTPDDLTPGSAPGSA